MNETVTKVPEVTFVFWIIKIAATMLGETITFSQTLGTALGDWMADSTGLGYKAARSSSLPASTVLAALYYWTEVSRVFLFWAAFILTRPLGAIVGDYLDKPISHGGLALSRPIASAVIATFIIGFALLLPQRAGRHPALARAEVSQPDRH